LRREQAVSPSVPSLPEPVRVILKAVIVSFVSAGLIDGHAATLLIAILNLEDA
jgi:hypothetical protein